MGTLRHSFSQITLGNSCYVYSLKANVQIPRLCNTFLALFQRLAVQTWFHLRMRGSNEKMTRSPSVVTRHDRRGSCVVMTAGGPALSPTAATRVSRAGFRHYSTIIRKTARVFRKIFMTVVVFVCLKMFVNAAKIKTIWQRANDFNF